MISNRVGYSPAVRQATPQRQNFGKNIRFGTPAERNLLINLYGTPSRIISEITTGLASHTRKIVEKAAQLRAESDSLYKSIGR